MVTSNSEERPGAYVVFFAPDGPLLTYSRAGVLRIDDLNPQKTISFRMSRSELLSLGWRAIWIAIKATLAGKQ